jgi:DNA-binding CsgD family transcriptional regulator
MGRTADLPALIDLIYQAAVDPAAWSAATTRIADALQASALSLHIEIVGGTRPRLVVAPRSDPDWLRIYVERWASSNLIRDRSLATMPVGVTHLLENLMPRASFERTAYYNEFLAPQGINHGLLMNLALETEAVSGIGFYRGRARGEFGREEERLLQAIAPHLRRAVALNLRLQSIEMQRESTAEMLNRCADGALLLDAQARVLFANCAAEALLREGETLRVKDGRLAASTPATTAALRNLIAGGDGVAAGGALALPRTDGTRMAARVLPLKAETAWLSRSPAAIMFVKDPRASGLPSRDQIKELFDLTPAQAATAREILNGDGIQAVARRLRISPATARTHLLEVFQKTGTNRQAELVRVILQRTIATLQRIS